MNNEQYEESQQQQQAAYSGATATAVVVSDDQRNRSLVSNVADFYASNPYVYVPDANLMPAQALSANFFPPTAYFPTGAPAALDFLAWTPWSFEMVTLFLNGLNTHILGLGMLVFVESLFELFEWLLNRFEVRQIPLA